MSATKRTKRTTVPSLTVGIAKARAADARRDEIKQFARDMVISCINAGVPMIPMGEAMRDFVRASRTLFSELDHPTVKPKPKAKTQAEEDADSDAEVMDSQVDNLEQDF